MENKISLYDSVISDIKDIIFAGRESVYNVANKAMILTYWNVGKRIVEEEQHGEYRAEYGKKLLSYLSDNLIEEFGKGFSERNFRKFYLQFPDIQIWNTCVPNLNWSHFRSLLRVEDETVRLWYMKEAANEGWSVRTLDRNIGTQYYHRLLHSPKKEEVIEEMKQKTDKFQKSKFELLKSPIVAEF